MARSLEALISKYDCAGPRYTSYPTAPTFSPGFRAAEYRQAIRAQEAGLQERDLSLYFHFPFCDTLCYFRGCTTFVTRNRDQIREYMRSLKKELALFVPLIHPRRRVVQMH